MTDSQKAEQSQTSIGGNVADSNVVIGDGNIIINYPHFPPALANLQRAFDNLIADRTEGFVGRRFVFDAITKFMEDQPRGYFFVRGDPGIGKSAIAAQLVKQYGCVHHFNIRAEGISKTSQFLESICTQLITDYQLEHPVLPPKAFEDANFMKELLDEVSSRVLSGKKIMIVVDALDEVSEETQTNILCLPKTLPKGVYIIATMRRVDIPLLIECEQDALNIVHDSAANLGDIREYVLSRVRMEKMRAYIAMQKIDPELFTEHLVEHSEGNFMYLHYVLPDIERGVYSDLEINSLPKGLDAYYEDHWRRMGMMEKKKLPREKIRIVYILSEVRQPVSRRLIAQFANTSDMNIDELMVQSILDEWNQFLHKQSNVDGSRYRVYHPTFGEFLHRKDIVQAAGITIEGIHALIADNLWNGLFGDE